jgi:unsaturated chondroitin disaccharide hydrolase
MMNLPLLFTISQLEQDPRFFLMVRQHARTVLRDFQQPDGSCHHIICYDPMTGEVKATPVGQGYAAGSNWSRGQAWALYGFVLSYMYTGEQAFVDAACRVADYFLSHLPDDLIAPIDFMQPREPAWKDACSTAVAASGLIELSRAVKNAEAAKCYMQSAAAVLKSLTESADASPDFPAALTLCSSKYHQGSHHTTMVYADYFYVEGLRKLLGETRLFWKPLDFQGMKEARR